MKVRELIGIRIKRLRQERRLFQEALVERVGISPKYVGIERGKENHTLDVLIELADTLMTGQSFNYP
jgi:transcriptional regulator with XRE-family HTH domain